jgi:hypothetical protein
MQRTSRQHRNWLLKLAAPEMKLVAWFPSSLEDTRALAVVQDCTTATILESTGIYAPGFSPDRCREQGWLLKKSVFLKKAEIRVIENVQETGKNRL